jgi:hypothetical protein
MATSDQLEQHLQRWTDAGILDSESAGRIREFESAHESPEVRWPVIFAIAFGSIMVAAGVLRFVAAHWDDLSPTQRFLLVLTMIAGFHLAGGMLMPRFRALGLSLHAIGTVALGGGIYLAGQIFISRNIGRAASCCGRSGLCFRGWCCATGSTPRSVRYSPPRGSLRSGACGPATTRIWIACSLGSSSCCRLPT